MKLAKEHAATAPNAGSPLKAVLDHAQAHGEKAALEWAREKLEQGGGIGNAESTTPAPHVSGRWSIFACFA